MSSKNHTIRLQVIFKFKNIIEAAKKKKDNHDGAIVDEVMIKGKRSNLCQKNRHTSEDL